MTSQKSKHTIFKTRGFYSTNATNDVNECIKKKISTAHFLKLLVRKVTGENSFMVKGSKWHFLSFTAILDKH